MKRTYSQEEVDAILDRALRAQAKDGSNLTHEELVSAAAEVGIPKEAIDAAARDVERGKRERAGEGEPTDQQLVLAWKRRARFGFIRHFVTFAIVCAMLAFINLMVSASVLWFPIVMLAWGLGIAMHLLSVVYVDEERIVERQRRKLARQQRRAIWKRRSVEFERTIDEGVRALMGMANRHGARIDVPTSHFRVGERELDRDDLEDPEDHADHASRRRRRR